MAKLERTKAMTTIILSVYVGHSKHKNVCAAHDTRENKKNYSEQCVVCTLRIPKYIFAFAVNFSRKQANKKVLC